MPIPVQYQYRALSFVGGKTKRDLALFEFGVSNTNNQDWGDFFALPKLIKTRALAATLSAAFFNIV
jgi:hypothetical protein